MTDAGVSNKIFAVFEQVITQFSTASGAELGAVVFALAYIYLVGRQNVWCWACGFISTGLFTYVFWDVSLVFSMLLNVYYMVMAGYGYWQWTRGDGKEVDDKSVSESNSQLDIQNWSLLKQTKIVSTTALIGGLLVWLRIDENTPLTLTLCLDAFVSVFSVVATYMVAHKIYHNWHYWIVINAAAAVLYYQYGLYFSSLLFVIYIGFSVHGLLEWRKALRCPSSSY